MRVVLVHPNSHSGGAEIAGSWPPAWAAYLAGSLRAAGHDDIHFIDAMTNDLDDAEVGRRIAALSPDVADAPRSRPPSTRPSACWSRRAGCR